MNHKNCHKKQVLHCGNIFNKVLMAVQTFTDIKEKNPEIEDIHEYMLCKYIIEGDLYSQILNALERGLRYGFLHKKKNKYSIVCPAATISFKNKPKMFELERIQSIFHSRVTLKNQSLKRKIPTSYSLPRKKRKVHSCGDIRGKVPCVCQEKESEEKSEVRPQDPANEGIINEDTKSKSIYEFYT